MVVGCDQQVECRRSYPKLLKTRQHHSPPDSTVIIFDAP